MAATLPSSCQRLTGTWILPGFVHGYVTRLSRITPRLGDPWQPGYTYNVHGRNERVDIDVVRRICVRMDRLHPADAPCHELISFVADRPGHDQRYAIDATKLETDLGWRAHETFETGIEKTVRWYLDRSDWWKPLRDKVYGGERLGLVKA